MSRPFILFTLDVLVTSAVPYALIGFILTHLALTIFSRSISLGVVRIIAFPLSPGSMRRYHVMFARDGLEVIGTEVNRELARKSQVCIMS